MWMLPKTLSAVSAALLGTAVLALSAQAQSTGDVIQSAPKAAAQPAPTATGAIPAPKAPAKKTKDTDSKTAAAAPPASSKSGKGSSNQAIIALINDEPLTAYEVDQRAAFIALSTGQGGDMKAKAEARWKQIIKDPSTNTKFQDYLKANNATSKEQAQALQAKFVKQLQQNMMAQIQREARSGAVAGSRTKAQDELIDEKIKLQEAKKLNAVASAEDVSTFIRSIAERNKMNETQFAQHMKGMGVDVETMRSRFRAELSWREVIRRKFGNQISVTGRDVDRAVANSTTGGDDDVALQLQRISLFMAAKADQAAIAKRLGEAETLASQFTTCADIKALTAKAPGARYEDLGERRPSEIPEPTRSMLINSPDGAMLPPVVGNSSIDLWAVCGRKTVTANEQKREAAEGELRQKEFEIMAKKHLNDLRQDAAIEYR